MKVLQHLRRMWAARMFTKDRSREEVATYIENFVNGSGGDWDWDDFISVPILDVELDRLRQRCAGLPCEYPPDKPGYWCNAQGMQVMREIVREL